MYLGERYPIDITEHSDLDIPEGQQPAQLCILVLLVLVVRL